MSLFISRIHNSNVKNLEQNSAPLARLVPIAWPSEVLADVGPFSIGECKRSLFYKILGTPYSNPMTLRGASICDLGILLESEQIKTFKEHNLFVEEQKRAKFIIPKSSHNIEMSGKIDVIINDNNIKKAIEIKTVSGFGAEPVFGTIKKIGLPKVSNLMQAMIYKYYLSNIEIEDKVEEVYLLYIDRADGRIIYYKIDLDNAGYPIITTIDNTGLILRTIKVQEMPSYNDFINGKCISTEELGRIAELRFTIYDIFSKLNIVYDYTSEKMLPSVDYKFIYNKEDLEKELLCSRITPTKYKKAIKDNDLGDSRCSYCSYRDRCLADSGIRMK